jgi:DNA-binding NarL/FixJ family response regulator
MRISVFLLDDHSIVRDGLRSLLHTTDDIEVVGEAGDGLTGLDRILSIEPDVVVSDISMPGMGGLEVLRHLQRLDRPSKLLFLSMHHDMEWVESALDAGASGYLVKGAGLRDLLTAVRTVAKGCRFLSPRVQRALTFKPLTPRERQVLLQVTDGKRSQAIAQELGISVRTVEHHRARLMHKLGINDVPGLTRYVMRQGLMA